MRGRKVQGDKRIGCVHGLRGRGVFYNSRGLKKFDMHRLSVKLRFACGKLSFEEMPGR